MKTKHFTVCESFVENGLHITAGANTFSFEGIVEAPNGKMEQYTFTVEGVNDRLDAINVADAWGCGYFDRYSVTNVRKE